MTPQQLMIRLNRAAKYLAAGNPRLIFKAADLREAAEIAKLPPLNLHEPVGSSANHPKVSDDPLAVAMATAAVAVFERWRAMKPSAALIERRRATFDAALARVSAIAA